MDKRIVLPGIAIAVLGFLAILMGCSKAPADAPASEASAVETTREVKKVEPRGKAYYSYFDTVSYVYSYAGDSDEEFNRLTDGASAVLNDWHMLLDIYYEYSGINNLCTINRNAGGEPIEVDQRIIDFLLYAKELHELTGGRMNVMMGSVLSLWHEARYAEVPYLPEKETLEEAAGHVGFQYLEIDQEKRTVRLTDPKASIDAGALGKGYATEMAARWLEENGGEHYVLNIGGNIRIVGTKLDGSGWRTSIRDPRNPDGNYSITLLIADTACVTSGSYERFFTVDGKRYSHIIDPETLFPSERFGSVSIVTKDSGLADALSTALFCMSYEKGLELVEGMEGVDVVWIFNDGTVKTTGGLSIV